MWTYRHMPELPLTGVSKKLHYPLRIFAIHPPLEEVGVFLQKIDKNKLWRLNYVRINF
jgi:hypothetical protein